MVEKVNESFAGSSIWQIRSADNLLFYSSIKHSVFARVGTLSAEDKKAIKLPANASLVQEQCAAAAVKVIKEKRNVLTRELNNDIFSTSILLVEGIWDALTENLKELDKEFAKGARIVKGHLKAIEVIYTAGKIILIGDGKVKEEIVIAEVASLLGAWTVAASASGLIKGGAAIVMGSAAALASPVVATLAVVVGAAFSLMYLWYDWDKWVADNAPEFWKRIKDGTILMYLESVGAITKLKKLVSDWERDMKASLEEVINPKIEHAIEDYVELYAKGTISEGMMVTNWIDRYINIFLRAAGIPIFNEK